MKHLYEVTITFPFLKRLTVWREWYTSADRAKDAADRKARRFLKSQHRDMDDYAVTVEEVPICR